MTSLRELNGTYQIDASHSTIGFMVRHAMVTKVRGRFTDVEGTAVIDGSNPEASSVELTIQPESVDSRSEDRDAHLRSGDFFDVENHPTWTFRSTKVEFTADDEVEVTGELNLKGQTHTVTIPLEFTGAATDPFGNERIGFEGTLDVNRKDWGLTWNAALETGGVLVSEKVKLEFDISAIKQA